VVEGDARRTVARVTGPVDIVFIDADKEGYLDYLDKMLPLVRRGGLILVHNVDSAGDYARAVTSSPALETLFNTTSGGLAVTLKKR
jgi:caffeoyl-CoA O-methyltransferase